MPVPIPLTILDQALFFCSSASGCGRSVRLGLSHGAFARSVASNGDSERPHLDADFALESALLAKEEMIKQLAEGFVLTNTNEILRSTLNLLR